MRNLERILAKFEKIVSPDVCNDLAKRTLFVQRSTSRLSGYEFVQALILPNGFIAAETLSSLTIRIHAIQKTCDISTSALAQRIYSKNAPRLLQACYAKVLKAALEETFADCTDLPALAEFNRILIQDSTTIELHEKLSPNLKGSGGSASKAAIKIDCIFEYRSEQLIDVEFCPGNNSDQCLAKRIVPLLQKNDLVLRDLGYYALEGIRGIGQKEAYYISRLKVSTNVYQSKEATSPLNMAEFIKKSACQGILDESVFIGEERTPVRIVASELCEQIVSERLRKARRTAQRHGRMLGKKSKALMKYALFITNIPSHMLSSVSVMATYRARWRIELMFKEWKSCLHIDVFKGYNQERLYCTLYGRLIMVLLLGLLSSHLMLYAHTLGRELSCYKLIKYLIWDHGLAMAIQEGTLADFVDQLLQNLPRKLCKDRRKRASLRANVRVSNNYQEVQLSESKRAIA